MALCPLGFAGVHLPTLQSNSRKSEKGEKLQKKLASMTPCLCIFLLYVSGIECHQFLTSDKDNLTLLFNEMERNEEEIEVNVLDRIQAETKHIWDGIDDIRSHHFG